MINYPKYNDLVFIRATPGAQYCEHCHDVFKEREIRNYCSWCKVCTHVVCGSILQTPNRYYVVCRSCRDGDA